MQEVADGVKNAAVQILGGRERRLEQTRDEGNDLRQDGHACGSREKRWLRRKIQAKGARGKVTT